MYKQATFAALAATAFVAAPASAATLLTVTNSSPAVCATTDATCNFVITGEVDTSGSFTVTSNAFLLPGWGIFGGTATNTATDTTDIDFDSVMLTNTTTGDTYTGTFNNGFFSIAFSGPDTVEAGLFTLTLGGIAQTFTGLPPSYPSIGGSASFFAAAVPEPATWALFILGFGMIGAGLRRRSGAVRTSKAKLHFT